MIDSILVVKPKSSKLSWRLAQLFSWAQAHQGKKQRIDNLGSGLAVEAMYGLDGELRFQISRLGVYPSEQEWKTIIQHLPFEKISVDGPAKFDIKGWFYMRGEIKGKAEG